MAGRHRRRRETPRRAPQRHLRRPVRRPRRPLGALAALLGRAQILLGALQLTVGGGLAPPSRVGIRAGRVEVRRRPRVRGARQTAHQHLARSGSPAQRSRGARLPSIRELYLRAIDPPLGLAGVLDRGARVVLGLVEVSHVALGDHRALRQRPLGSRQGAAVGQTRVAIGDRRRAPPGGERVGQAPQLRADALKAARDARERGPGREHFLGLAIGNGDAGKGLRYPLAPRDRLLVGTRISSRRARQVRRERPD